MFVRKICIDFDGVIHSYDSGWEGIDKINDSPVKGAFNWLRELIADENIEPLIYSSRSQEKAGILAMKEWFLKHGLSGEELNALSFPVKKPAAFLTIDDRAICFNGAFPSIKKIKNFKPWNNEYAIPGLNRCSPYDATIGDIAQIMNSLNADSWCLSLSSEDENGEEKEPFGITIVARGEKAAFLSKALKEYEENEESK